jgi:hypothetical protein
MEDQQRIPAEKPPAGTTPSQSDAESWEMKSKSLSNCWHHRGRRSTLLCRLPASRLATTNQKPVIASWGTAISRASQSTSRPCLDAVVEHLRCVAPPNSGSNVSPRTTTGEWSAASRPADGDVPWLHSQISGKRTRRQDAVQEALAWLCDLKHRDSSVAWSRTLCRAGILRKEWQRHPCPRGAPRSRRPPRRAQRHSGSVNKESGRS